MRSKATAKAAQSSLQGQTGMLPGPNTKLIIMANQDEARCLFLDGEKMIRTFTKQLLSTALSFLLVITAVPFEAEGQQPAPAGSTGYSGQGAPLSADELQQLVAPIALYPDALVAQILGAATFPDQVAAASGWLQQNKNLTGTALMQAVDAQPWDPSVKALTQFPSVLDNLAKNLSWTSALGEAYHTQAADVMSAVQVLRAKAKLPAI